MIAHLKLGDPVKVWPRPGYKVQEYPSIPGRFLPNEGKEIPWSAWAHDRVRDGSMLLTDPRPAAAQPKGDK